MAEIQHFKNRIKINVEADKSLLIDLTKMPMPFGKYKGTILMNLPVFYVEWFARNGFPAGRLGKLLQTLHEIKLNGLDGLLHEIRLRQQQG
jgi:uncharacterized protein